MAALNNISADLLPSLESVTDEPRGEETLAHCLPHVAWDRIAYYLSDDSATLLTLATFSQALKDICRPHISKHYEKLPTGQRFLYHRVLQLVLERYVDPSYIYEIDCENAKLDWGNVERGAESPEDLKYKNDAVRSEGNPDDRKRHVLKLLREAVRISPWIPQAKEDIICDQLQFGDPDPALAVLLPLCTKLKTLEIPNHTHHCAAVVQAVAQAYRQRGITGAEARRTAWEAALRDRASPAFRRRPEPDTLPFSELVTLHTQDRAYSGCGPSPADITAFMGIPSLHRIVLDAVRAREFPAWPLEHVKCSCPEIWLRASTFGPRAVLALARSMADSCEIRQHFHMDPHWLESTEDMEITWDSVLVRCREDGSKEIESHIVYEGGDPGYEHAWVSWLYWDKMKDWKRLDEEFGFEEGDDKRLELGGGL